MNELFKMGRQSGKSTSLEALRDFLTNVTAPMVLSTSEGEFLGQTYYCVEPRGWAYAGLEWNDMQAWCEKTLGPVGLVWHTIGGQCSEPFQRWYVNGGQFWFRDEADRTMFVLRWSS